MEKSAIFQTYLEGRSNSPHRTSSGAFRELPTEYQTEIVKKTLEGLLRACSRGDARANIGSTMKYVIACPHQTETIEVPDDSKADFRGEVSCGDEDAPRPLRIWIVRARLVEVERAN